MGHRRILVVGNYSADRIQSMDRYADLLVRLYRPHGQVQLIRPPVIITKLPCLPALARKYLAYIDKLLLFPLWLMLRAGTSDLVHIADHGNAFYAFCCPRRRCLVTCHDLLAVRSAMGDRSTAILGSPIAIWLQRLIMSGLRHSGGVIFVSEATKADYVRLVGQTDHQRRAVIPNALNAPFRTHASSDQLAPDDQRLVPQGPYLLMVGSSHPRKNRALGLNLLLALAKASARYSLVFAGDPLSPAELHFLDSNPLGSRLITIENPSHALLNVLYCRAHALLFPSIAEGFGWPLIEAQASGCPVIASTTTSIPEVAGSAALYGDPQDVKAFRRHVRALEDPSLRKQLIQEGFKNIRRYAPELISQQLLAFAFEHSPPACSPAP